MKNNTIISLLLSFFLIVSFVKGSCPVADCSGHGACVSDKCECNGSWQGIDCSISITKLPSGTTLTDQSVAIREYVYYEIDVPDNSGLTVEVKQTSDGDADVYVDRCATEDVGTPSCSLPDRRTYLVRDTTDAEDIVIDISEPQKGTWYVAVYGFYAVDFEVTLTLTSACPNDCSGNGQCIVDICSCDEGYGGNDCSKEVTKLDIGASLDGQTVAKGKWAYYAVSIPAQGVSSFKVVVNETTQSSDTDVYVRYLALPSFQHFDIRDVSIASNYVLDVENVDPGVYYVGINGFKASEFDIEIQGVSPAKHCSNDCTNRGECNDDGSCTCNAGFSGKICNEMEDELQLDEPVDGIAKQGVWNYYHISAFTANNLVIAINETDGSSDCDLFISAGQKPTSYKHDYYHIGVDSDFDITIENPGDATWYIGVYGFHTCEYELIAFSTSDCNPECQGECGETGDCICRPGQAGEMCELTIERLENNELVDGVAQKSQWIYYNITVQTSSLSVHVQETESTGNLWVYMQKGEFPTTREYLYSDVSPNAGLHRLNHVVTGDAESNQSWIIGVYGSYFAAFDRDIPFQLIAYATPF